MFAYSIGDYDKHKKKCQGKIGSQQVKIQEKPIQFEIKFKKAPTRIIGFVDFESRNKWVPCRLCNERKCDCEDIKTMKTRQIKEQTPICYNLLILDLHLQEVLFHNTFFGDDCAEHLLITLCKSEKHYRRYLDTFVKPIIFGEEEDKLFRDAKDCYLCGKPKTAAGLVRDHDHSTGKFLGAAHYACNLARARTKRIPIFAHNLCG